MKKQLMAIAIAAAASLAAHAQAFDTGSTGADGALNVTDANVTVQLPPNGRLNYTSVNVAAGRTLSFTRNALNTPVYLLSQGDIVVDGTIDVSGGQAPGNPPIGGVGGPGGFNGGSPGFGAEIPPGDGFGPGAGGAHAVGVSNGGGSYGALGSAPTGGIYGSPLLIPLVGGSGGGGDTGVPGNGGGGGGGAILLASNTQIKTSGSTFITASGGSWRGSSFNGGSGGAIRLLAPKVTGNGRVGVSGGPGGGVGRIRVDTIDKTSMSLRFEPLEVTTVGANLFVEPSVVPRLDVLKVADKDIAVGTGETVRILLPFGSDTNRNVTIQAKDFGADVPITLALTPDSGARILINTNINNTAANPATLVIPIGLPVNTQVTINAWTR